MSVLESVKLSYPKYKVVGIFQPHTISRSIVLKDAFKKALSCFDKTYIMRIFTSVRENVNIEKEKNLFEEWGFSVLSKEEVTQIKIEDNTVYLFIGAGDIDMVFRDFIEFKNIPLNQ